MNQEHRVQLFDAWAEHYDHSIRDGAGFPLDGYEQVLDAIVQAAAVQSGMKILDLGIGTGNLAVRFAALGCDIWGVDFSVKMLEKAAEKLPQAVLLQADLSKSDWSAELDQRFHRIVSAYVLHEFELSTKVNLIRRLAEEHLVLQGRIVIGDVAFPTTSVRNEARRKWAELWDEEEYYWVAEEAADACKSAGLQATYKQISSCGGVFVIESVGQYGSAA